MSSRKCLLTAAVVAALLVVISPDSNALWIRVSRPDQLAYSLTYPDQVKRQIAEALTLKGCEFIEGCWCNGTTTVDFSGDTASLNTMLARLADCPEVTVDVSFKVIDKVYDWGLGGVCDWQVLHESRSNSFRLFVNLKSDNIHLEDLVIPSAKGPKLVP